MDKQLLTEGIGWAASAILLATLIRQIVKQAKTEHPEAISTWLFIGQAAASTLFVIYSILVGNTVFIVTNSCLLLTALVGQWLSRR
ncbi:MULTISPECIES: PQ-loop domain-containing transporter [Stenotrophomonas]|uniref:PQ-loop domain-containing transporter n=1 Tax=Stenotrophomonas TaxID=40323 RepID=UPI0007701A94|nr:MULTISPECIES: PQ-loop domain-containing transporter [Stenotrophomonas]AMJ55267.1 hypothetical protein AXG53_00435 [Stenotrophomonas sp. KCTC 12332]